MRRLLAIAAVVALVYPSAVAAAAAAPGSYVLTLSTEDVNLIFWALGKQPYEAVARLVDEIRVQIQRQNAEAGNAVRGPQLPEKPPAAPAPAAEKAK